MLREEEREGGNSVKRVCMNRWQNGYKGIIKSQMLPRATRDRKLWRAMIYHKEQQTTNNNPDSEFAEGSKNVL